ncbi:hypothetical protein L4X63_19065 [Geomonas sp. Red32]|uniref:hypothetical protein n=1 Tax=Geomonas sp. Red32 TaxID=2912856 RepID=UPI00202CBA23|nr:hypothetical protein [Geomonas sp. Red32]MCM0083692.1 hypothetical protein [Geomonas sp. Red32]
MALLPFDKNLREFLVWSLIFHAAVGAYFWRHRNDNPPHEEMVIEVGSYAPGLPGDAGPANAAPQAAPPPLPVPVPTPRVPVPVVTPRVPSYFDRGSFQSGNSTNRSTGTGGGGGGGGMAAPLPVPYPQKRWTGWGRYSSSQ